MNKFIKLEKVVNSNVKELRKLFDRDPFRPLLIHRIFKKLPNVIRLQMS